MSRPVSLPTTRKRRGKKPSVFQNAQGYNTRFWRPAASTPDIVFSATWVRENAARKPPQFVAKSISFFLNTVVGRHGWASARTTDTSKKKNIRVSFSPHSKVMFPATFLTFPSSLTVMDVNRLCARKGSSEFFFCTVQTHSVS